MAGIVDYASLKTELGNFLHRTDTTGEYDTLIQLAELEFQRGLRFRQMLAVANPVSSSNIMALPADFLELRNLELQGNPIITLEFMTWDQKDLYDGGTNTGQPRMYTIMGNNIYLYPTPDTAYTANLQYYQKIPTLVGGVNTNNWLLTAHPDLYLFGALLKSGLYIGQDPRMQDWIRMYSSILQIVKAKDADAMYSGDTVRMRADVGR